MTSATEVLRRLLDERGVEYRVSATGYSIDIGPNMTAYANRTDTTLDVSLRGFTPEQAIDATLGRGTCKLDFTAYTKGGVDFAGFRCDGCGFTQAVPSGDLWGVTRFWSYCPNCGKRVVE